MGASIKRKKTRAKTVILGVFLLLYIPSLLNWIYGKHTDTAIIRIGTLEESINVNGYIIRDSVIYNAPFDGKYIPQIMEGERVSANSRIATVLKASSVKFLEALKKKEQEIIRNQNEKSMNLELFSEDIGKIEDEIEKKVRSVIYENSLNRLSEIGKVREDIEKLMNKKAEIIGGAFTGNAYIESLKSEIENLKKQINANTQDIITESSGIVSYVVDEYEEALNPAAMKNFTAEMFDNIVVSRKKENKSNNEVSAGKPFVKVIKGINYYIAVPLEEKEARYFNETDYIVVRINDIGSEIKGRVLYKTGLVSGKCVITIALDRYMEETAGLRKVNVDLIKNFHEGLKVPLKSLINVDFEAKTAKIALVKANSASIREVKIVGWDNEFAIIENTENNVKNGVSLYDTYIINPVNIEEGQVINK